MARDNLKEARRGRGMTQQGYVPIHVRLWWWPWVNCVISIISIAISLFVIFSK